jgi:hypothetical protein
VISGKIKIVEYGPEEDPLGYIEPTGKSPSWILWWWQDGHAELYTKRDKNGAISGEPVRLPAPKG